jgi:lysyl-tRNA synthetase class II
MQPTPATAPEHSESELLQFRREKLDAQVKAGLNPFGDRFDTTHQPGALKANFEEEPHRERSGPHFEPP